LVEISSAAVGSRILIPNPFTLPYIN
jgi:hypothetical protein